MIKSLGKNWIWRTYPLVSGCLAVRVLALTIVLGLTNTTCAQLRKSAASIPYGHSEQANSYATRSNPIRLVQAQTGSPSGDPFAPMVFDSGDFDDFENGFYGDASEQHYPHPDIPEDFSNDLAGPDTFFLGDDNAHSIEPPSAWETLPSLHQNTNQTQRQQPTYSLPSDVNLGDLEEMGGLTQTILDEIRRQNEQDEREREKETSPSSPVIRHPVPPPSPPIEPDWALPQPPERTATTPSPAISETPTVPTTPPEKAPSSMGPLKHERPQTKRDFQDCNIGRDMRYQDQYGLPVELTPFAGLFMENPCAPLFSLGGSHGDFFGDPHAHAVRPCGWLFDNMEVFFGMSGFGLRSGAIGTTSIDETSFGIHEGINWSGSVSPRFGLAAQFGVRAVQRTIDGTNPLLAPAETPWSSKGRSQVFITTGLFKRAQSHPWQYGVVYDWMSDNKYQSKRMAPPNEKLLEPFNFGQIRTELSYKFCSGFTWGFRGAFGVTQSDVFSQPPFMARATTQLHGFFEKPLWCNSLAGFSAGGTPKGNAILSAYYDQPLSDKFSLKTGFTYMLPQKTAFVQDERNAWEAAITLTFHPHGGAFSKNCNPLRAMFDIAGNGSMIASHRK